MKRTLFIALAALAVMNMGAQSFTVHTTDGQVIGYDNNQVERIEFSMSPLDPVPVPPEPLDFNNFYKSITPPEGLIDIKGIPTGLGRIFISLKGVFKANTECAQPLTLSNSEGIVFSRTAADDGVYCYSDVLTGTTEFVYDFSPSGFVSPGNYYLEIPEGFYADTQGTPLGRTVRVFVIESEPPTQTLTTAPQSGTVERIENIIFRFDNYRSVTVNPSARAYVYREGSNDAAASAVPVETGNGSFSVTFSPAILNAGIYTVTIPHGSFTLREDESGQGKTYASEEIRTAFEIEGAPLAEPRLGDFYYSDGTWSSTLVDRDGVEPIGVIFYIGVGTGDNKSYYKVKDGSAPMEEFHGYVVALRDATYFEGEHHGAPWHTTAQGYFNGSDTGCGCSVSSTAFDGYTNTASIRARADRDFGGLSGNDGNLPAAWYATDFFESQVPAPAQSSGWFMPSEGQLKYIWDNAYFEPNGNPDSPYVEKSLLELKAKGGMVMYDRDSEYWTSTEVYDSSGKSYRARYVAYDSSLIDPGFGGWSNKSNEMRVRAILAF